jgi:hypothetical protein
LKHVTQSVGTNEGKYIVGLKIHVYLQWTKVEPIKKLARILQLISLAAISLGVPSLLYWVPLFTGHAV